MLNNRRTIANKLFDGQLLKLLALHILGSNLIFESGLVNFVPAATRLVCPDVLGPFYVDYVLQTLQDSAKRRVPGCMIAAGKSRQKW